jgi:glutathione synthase/RimK-type ligase-like ATP-grasp enzyme
MLFIAARNGAETARLLALRCGADYIRWMPRRQRWSSGFPDVTTAVVRWGACKALPHFLEGLRILNTSKGILTASEKGTCRVLLASEGVAVPEIITSATSTRFPMVARPMHHQRGKFFFVISSAKELAECLGKGMYVARVYPKTKEWRVHCGHGKVLAVCEKPLVEGDIRGNMAITHEEWRVLPWSEYDVGICRIALDALRVVGLDFGGVDVMSHPTDDSPRQVVCEINTAPTVSDSEYMLGRYSAYFLVAQDLKHYDYTKWKEGKSFAWKNQQLKK